MSRGGLARAAVLALASLAPAADAAGQAPGPLDAGQAVGPHAAEPGAVTRMTFDEAVGHALARNPSVGEAVQAILRAEAFLSEARAVFLPYAAGSVATTVLDAARGFDQNVVQPRTQTAFSATASYAFFAPARWAAKNQAADQVASARIAADETRRQVAVAAAQAYLAVLLAQRQREVTVRNRDTARALEAYARTRLEAGQGSRLNHVRAVQQLASGEALVEIADLALARTQEALGTVVFAPGPVDALGEPRLPEAEPPMNDAWLARRTDVQLFQSELAAAERRTADAWKSWLPSGTASFTPRYVTPAGLFEPSKTWRALFQLEIPIFDGTLQPQKRARVAEQEAARLRLDGLTHEARSELRLAQESVRRNERIVAQLRLAATSAQEALRITEVAYRAGATTNIEVIQAQQVARNNEIEAELAEDRLRQARLDLLVALGSFRDPLRGVAAFGSVGVAETLEPPASVRQRMDQRSLDVSERS